MRILLLCKYSRLGASSRLRTLQYLPFLEGEGVEVTVSSLFDDEYLNCLYSHQRRAVKSVVSLYLKRLVTLLDFFRYDLVWIEKEIFPVDNEGFEFLGRVPVLAVDGAPLLAAPLQEAQVQRALKRRLSRH